jgi:hypothetical protein
MIWGFGPTEQYIYASSEPKDDKCFEGYHKIFDVEKGASYDLDSKEAGDCLALTPDGLCHYIFAMISNDMVDRRVHSCPRFPGA